MDIDYDFSDVDQFFEIGWKELREEVEQVAKEAIQYARDTQRFNNWTYNLRHGHEFHVTRYASLDLWNNMFYAPYVEAKGYDVLTGAALYARSELRKRIG